MVQNVASAQVCRIFQDDFNDNVFDSTKWAAVGTSVFEQNGVMNVNRDATDAGGILWSKWISVNGNLK